MKSTESEDPQINCPSCGYLLTDLYEYGGPFELENDSVQVDCDCGANLLLKTRVLVTYILTEVEPPKEAS